MNLKSFFSRTDRPEVALTITARTFYKVLLLIFTTIFLLALLKKAEFPLTLIAVAFFLALALNAPVSLLARHLPGKLRGSRSWATAISFLFVIVLLAAFLLSVLPPTIRQTAAFIDNAPQLVQSVRDRNSSVNRFITRYHLQGQVDSLSSELATKLKENTGTAVTAATGVLSTVFSVLTILVLTFMALVEGPNWVTFGRELLPEAHRRHADRLINNMYRAVRGYVNGQVVLAVVASILVLPGLLVFHVSYPFALMAVVFICGLIPMVGHTIGAIIVTFIALFHSPFSAAGILLYYFLYQQIENYLIQPRLQANTTNLSPLLVLISVIVGASLGGLLGGLVAIPVVACLRVWVLDYLESRHMITTEPASLVPSAKD